MPVVLLLDIDDVLVLPVGYKRGIPATLGTFTRRLGWEIPLPTEGDIEWFEASGVTSEWDSTAICLAGLLLEAARLDERWIVPDFEEAMARLAERALDGREIRPHYVAWVKAAGEAAQPGERPSQAALRLWRQELLPQLPRSDALAVLLDVLLANTHRLSCPTTAVFQAWMVGSQAYREAYGQPAPVEVPRGLLEEDQPLLAYEGSRALVHVWHEGRLAPAFYTSRPSRPPLKEPPPPFPVYSPEAELAARQIRLEDWPPVGLGRLFWLADAVGLRENPTKPHPIHGMAAFAAAIASVDGIPETQALQSASTVPSREALSTTHTEAVRADRSRATKSERNARRAQSRTFQVTITTARSSIRNIQRGRPYRIRTRIRDSSNGSQGQPWGAIRISGG